jgi:hypothetical protein
VLTLLGQYFVVKSIRPDTRLDRKTAPALFGKLLIGILAMQLIMLTTDWYTLLLIVMLFPLPMLYNFILQVEKKDIGFSAKRMFFLLGNNYARVLGLFILLLLLSLFFFMIVDSSLINFFFNYISWVIYLEQSAMDQLSVILLTFVSVFVCIYCICLLSVV